MITNTSTPYNGTVFNLTSAIQLDRSNVDIGIAVSWRWSLGENTLRIQETLLAPHQSSLSFQPLATNSSGVYRLSVTLTPLDDSPFIVESSNSSTYDLSVLRKYL